MKHDVRKGDARPYLIDRPETSAFFAHLHSVRHLHPFMQAEVSLAEAASQLGLSKSRMGYWLKKMLELNLIYKIRVERRGRYRVPIYTSRAEVFIIPLELVSDNPNKDILNLETFEKKLKHSLIYFAHKHFSGWHIQYSLENNVPRLDVLPAQIARDIDVSNYWAEIRLSKAEAKVFHRELKELFENYMDKARRDQGKKHLFKLVLVEERE